MISTVMWWNWKRATEFTLSHEPNVGEGNGRAAIEKRSIAN